MGFRDWDEKPYQYSKEEIENQRDLRVINTLYVIDWLQNATGKEALDIVAEEIPLCLKHRLLHLTFTLRRVADQIPSDIAHNIDSAEVIIAIWGTEANIKTDKA